MRRPLSLLLALALALPLALGGCGRQEAAELTLVLPQNVTSLDPQTASNDAARQVIGSIFEGLCRIGGDSQAVPGVAERWESDPADTVFTFYLRDARWSEGDPVAAEDFVFGITRALDPSVNAQFPDELAIVENARAVYAGEASAEALGVRAVDDRTLEIRLAYGYADFPLLTAGARYMPCQRAFFEETGGHYGLSAGSVLTNGPFTFPHAYAWDTGYNQRSIRLVRANEYRGEQAARAASLTYLIDYDDSVDQDPVAALAAGTVSALELTEPQARQAEERGLGALAVDDGVMGLLLNQDSAALGYRDTRSLFLKTIDRGQLLDLGVTDTRREAVGLMAGCVRWEGQPYYEAGEAFYPSQDDSVTQIIPSLLELMEWDQLPAITVLCPEDEDSIRLANGLIATWNAKLSGAFNILPLPESQLRQRVRQGDYEAALTTLRAGGATPYDSLLAIAQAAYPALDEDSPARSFDLRVVLADLTFSRQSFREMETALDQQAVFYPLLQVRSYYGLAPGISGISVSPDGWIDATQAVQTKGAG